MERVTIVESFHLGLRPARACEPGPSFKELNLRISFDLDDTLVCGPHVSTERFHFGWGRLWYKERLRAGTLSLMQELLMRQCEIWVYTTSYRSPRYVSNWFQCYGISVCDVVNQARHDKVVGRLGPSKYPPAFGIDLHVDDSSGVASEGKRYGFEVVVVSPEDAKWASRVLEAVILKV
jgi:hypothetical protein